MLCTVRLRQKLFSSPLFPLFRGPVFWHLNLGVSQHKQMPLLDGHALEFTELAFEIHARVYPSDLNTSKISQTVGIGRLNVVL